MPSSTSSTWWRREGGGRCSGSYVRQVSWSPWANPVHCWSLKPNILHYKTIFWPHSTKIYREPAWFLGLNFTWLILPPVLVNYQEIRSLSSLQSLQSSSSSIFTKTPVHCARRSLNVIGLDLSLYIWEERREREREVTSNIHCLSV